MEACVTWNALGSLYSDFHASKIHYTVANDLLHNPIRYISGLTNIAMRYRQSPDAPVSRCFVQSSHHWWIWQPQPGEDIVNGTPNGTMTGSFFLPSWRISAHGNAVNLVFSLRYRLSLSWSLTLPLFRSLSTWHWVLSWWHDRVNLPTR